MSLIKDVQADLAVLEEKRVPHFLRTPYRAWMGFSFVLGWFVSRILLGLLFFLILTPIAILGRLCRKEFLKLRMQRVSSSYWVPKKGEIRYERMY